MSVESSINQLISARNDIRAALVEKGDSYAAEHGFHLFAGDIRRLEIPFRFGGANPQLIGTHTETWTLADTTATSSVFSSPTEEEKIIKPSVANVYTLPSDLTIDRGRDAVVVQYLKIIPTYSSTSKFSGRQMMWQNYRWDTLCIYLFYVGAEILSLSNTITNNTFFNGNREKEYARNNDFGIYGETIPCKVCGDWRNQSFVIDSPILKVKSNLTLDKYNNMYKYFEDCSFEWTVEVYKLKEHTTPFEHAIETMYENVRSLW